MALLATFFKVGQTLKTKYPKHGNLNILKNHKGLIKGAGYGPGGPFATIQEDDGKYRSLSVSKMIDPSVS